jgi:dCMP deaminase
MNISYIRPSWNEYFMKLAWLVSERSTCMRHHIGAVIVKDKHILTTGYNGAATGIYDCLHLGCLRNTLKIHSGEKHEICRAIHAEQNAIIQGCYHGINIANSTMYCTHSPCILCAKMIINSHIKEIISGTKYQDDKYKALFKQARIKFSFLQIANFKIHKLL